jgi:peptidyl-prolyl cis-trans isomerase A (cyclophilin A)
MTLMVRRALCVAMAVACVAGALRAQDTRGELFGLVKDVPGAVLPGVTVTVAGSALPQPRTIVTDRSGAYHFADLPVGTYTVAFSAPGFFPMSKDSVAIAGGARVGLNVALAASGTTSGTPGPGLKPGEVLVRLDTPLGAIDIAVDATHAPITSANFLKYVDAGFYNNGRFHRVTRADNYTPNPPNRPMMELIQAGINPAREAEQFPPIPLERTSVTGLKHVGGTVSMARGTEADTAKSDVFILLDDQPSLDFGGMRFDDGQGAAAFGRVVAGLDVVRKIQQQPVDAQKKQDLNPPVTITRAARVR